MPNKPSTETCRIEGCEKPKKYVGMCGMHHERLRTRGTLAERKQPKIVRGCPAWDDGFGHWLAGFADGEGCFRIGPSAGRGYVFTFAIMLRDDDARILHECQWRTGLGTIHYSAGRGTSNDQAKWEVRRKTDCLLLTDVFDAYPLRAKKARDYAIWREGVLRWQNISRVTKSQDWAAIAALSETLRVGREYGAA